MQEVYFESDKEVISFCEQLFSYNKQIELHWKTNEDWGNHLRLESKLRSNELTETIAKSMADVFVSHRLRSTIKSIIGKYYYYSNIDEIERIMGLAEWIFEGADADSKQVRNTKDPRMLLKSLFIANIKDESTVHYDSIVKFRLKVFTDQLIHYVGLAIDEFKREEDHQAFVNTLREYIAKKEPSYNVIHVLQGNTFSFYKQNGKRFSKMELRTFMQKEPLYIVGLDANELNLSPLIAMAPQKIKIYGDHPSESKTLTVINVFQEKVDFEPYRKFPFAHKVMNQNN
ncbi:putative sporulation protein YtxC [Virgibacillus natechei]|uniref:Sporulation protein YtxC n=1 Tax=Virgibacillus natechei TaxID=1216297 RepID=A0ABS4IFP9_9BACI|nr:putative sporulation protein YtxC [Virgibacillus natechei]MBP1968859.1 putative sporulation protein YtxC [Virgibacillus natechei]UZD11655.1 putative sporulation protein YtxC [Virgibacillus natechei]